MTVLANESVFSRTLAMPKSPSFMMLPRAINIFWEVCGEGEQEGVTIKDP